MKQTNETVKEMINETIISEIANETSQTLNNWATHYWETHRGDQQTIDDFLSGFKDNPLPQGFNLIQINTSTIDGIPFNQYLIKSPDNGSYDSKVQAYNTSVLLNWATEFEVFPTIIHIASNIYQVTLCF